MPDHLRVEEGAVAGVARAFSQKVDRLGPVLSRFGADAYSVNDAFGPWGVSHEMLQEYLDVTYQALKGLHDVRNALEGNAERLRAADASYRAAESGSTYGR